MFEDDDYNRRVAREGLGDPLRARRLRPPLAEGVLPPACGEKQYLALFEENRKKYEEKWGEAWKAEGVDVWKRADLGFYREQLDAVRRRVADSKGAVIFLPSWAGASPSSSGRTIWRGRWPGAVTSRSSTAPTPHDKVTASRRSSPTSSSSAAPETLHAIPAPLLWAFPYNWPQTDGLSRGARTVYDWIDDLEVFPVRPRDCSQRNHARALAEAHGSRCVARRLHAQALPGAAGRALPAQRRRVRALRRRRRAAARRHGVARFRESGGGRSPATTARSPLVRLRAPGRGRATRTRTGTSS